jgi:DNA-binding CsgD family transcriptional regulator
MLVGRAAECARVEEELQAVRSGRGRGLVIGGEPGVGKTALLGYAVDLAGDCRVLRAQAVEAEAGWPYAGLHALLGPLGDLLDALPERQAAALRSALALTPTPPGLEVGAAVLSLLEAGAERVPVVCAVDDGQWLDPESAQALGFATRRLGPQRVLVLVALRGRPPHALAGVPELQLAGLAEDSALELLRRTVGSVPDEVGRRLVRAVGGHPLAITELMGTLTPAQLAGREPVEEPIRVTAAIERAFLAQAEHLSEAGRWALLVAAVGAGRLVAEVVRACSGSWAGVMEVEAAGLLRVEGPSLRFRHPLVRSAAYHAAAPEERRRAHLALAEALALSDPDRSTWHAAQAAAGPDEDLARALEASAARARRRGGVEAPARILSMAARLTSDPALRARRLLAAARASLPAGHVAEAEALIEEGLRLARDPLSRAGLVMEQASVAFRRQGLMPWQTVVAEASRLRSSHPAEAAEMLARAAFYLMDRPEVEPARPLVEQAWTLTGEGRPAVVAARAWLSILDSDVVTAVPLATAGLATPRLDPRSRARLAGVLMLAGETEAARRALEEGVERERQSGTPLGLAFLLSALSELELRQGRLLQACALVEEGLQLAGEGVGSWRRDCQRAQVESLLGHEATAREYVERAIRGGTAAGDGGTVARARATLGHLELSLGHHERAAELLAAADAAYPVRNPAVLACAGDLVEALVMAGRTADAAVALKSLERRASADPWSVAVVARCRILLGSDQRASTLVAALDAAGQQVGVLEQARTRLCLGERLRRQGRRLAAREHLSAAVEGFEVAGAALWSERGRRALEASGARLARRRPGPAEELTPRELQVALLGSVGATTREIADRLFMSPRTVEVHLTRIYQKLAVRSRTELAARFARGA